MTCKKCGKENRAEAKYCRFCGAESVSAVPFQGLIGKASAEPALAELDRKLKVAKEFVSNGTRVNLNCLILGDSGTGKNFIARLVAGKMLAAGVAKKQPTVVDASDWSDFLNGFESKIASVQDGILLITNAQKLLPASKGGEVNQLDKLFAHMRGTQGAPIVLLCGTRNDMCDFLAGNKDVHRLFEFDIMLDPFSLSDLTDLAERLLKDKFHMAVDDNLHGCLQSHFDWYMRQADQGHMNGHLAEKVAEALSVKATYRGSRTVTSQDIDAAKRFIPKTEAEIFAELDQFVGLRSVKDEIRAIVNNVKERKARGMKERILKDHYMFVGNPGTGKTTFARKFGEILCAIGALPTGQFVEISGKDLIGQFVGDSEANVKHYVNKAMGGVLFIDEAYALCGSNGDRGSFGLDAVNTLLTLLDNRKGDFVCIMAGYVKEMGEFARLNKGLSSRCNVTIEFPDYDARELEQIFRKMLASNDERTVFTLDPKAEEMLPKVFERMYLKRSDTFGNAREVRNLFDLAVKRHRARKASDDVLSYADLVGESETKDISVEDVMKELDGFVGMKGLKDAIRKIAGEIAVQKQLVEMGEAAEGLAKYNILITGNPGTGKTTVARVFGRIFKALGVTATDRVVEKEPKDIISKYVNESDKNMDAAITQAMGGVLFLDEAYDLEPMDAAGNSTSTEGKKAVQALLTRMDNDAGKFVLVCAGYPKEMKDWLGSNDGLERRFTHFLHIDDYTPEELLEIYERTAAAKKYDFVLAGDEVRMKVLGMFRNMVAMKNDRFGNAGEAVKKVAETKTLINNRIMSTPKGLWTKELLHTAYLEDIPFFEPRKVSVDDCLKELDRLVGLKGVKTSLTRLAHTINNEVETAKLENRKPDFALAHYLFLGNPGTGKTTVARLMGKILYSMGALPSPAVVEVDKSNLVGRVLGDTEAIVSHVIDTAMGGVLFIDEAYQLADDHYGQTALNVLLKRLEDDRGKFVCIAAGYTREMQAFVNSNSGLPSRFPQRNWIVFEDYSPDELCRIFMDFAAKDGYTLDPMATEAVRGKLTMLYNSRDYTFGNAREARNLFDEVKGNLAARLSEEGDGHTIEERKMITLEDVL